MNYEDAQDLVSVFYQFINEFKEIDEDESDAHMVAETIRSAAQILKNKLKSKGVNPLQRLNASQLIVLGGSTNVMRGRTMALRGIKRK